jgi:hypothetical protein
VLQPLTAVVIAGLAGLKDARAGRTAYCWALLANPVERRKLLREGWRDVARVFAFAVIVDLIYEVIAFRRVFPGESLIVATLLALLPYPFVRSFVSLIVCRFKGGARHAASARDVVN